MNTQDAACPNPECPMQGIKGAETIGIHSKKEKRFCCRKCRITFVATHGTMFYRRHYDEEFISEVLALLGRGCPRQAIVTTFEICIFVWPLEDELEQLQLFAERVMPLIHAHSN